MTSSPSAASAPDRPNSNRVDDEWTFVKSRRGRRNDKAPRRAVSPASPAPAPRSGPLRPVAEIAAEYRSLRASWESSPAGVSLRALVASHAGADAAAVSQAVCLGIGTFDPADGGWEARRRTYVQLIAFLVMVDELETRMDEGTKIPCFFQEPVFTASDKAFVESLGHRVVDSPAGCERVDSSTLLLGVHLYRPVYALALEKSLPAVFVGTGWDVWDQVSLAEEAHDLANLKAMEQTYDKAAFPQDALGTAFSSTSVYWRPPASREAATAAGESRGDAADAPGDLADKLASVSIK